MITASTMSTLCYMSLNILTQHNAPVKANESVLLDRSTVRVRVESQSERDLKLSVIQYCHLFQYYILYR